MHDIVIILVIIHNWVVGLLRLFATLLEVINNVYDDHSYFIVLVFCTKPNNLLGAWLISPILIFHIPLCLFTPTDPSLTITALTQLLGSVRRVGDIRTNLDVSSSEFNAIKDQSTNKAEGVAAWYLTNHPAPSWTHIAVALYEKKEHEVLKTLKEKVHYLKGI